MQEIFYSHRVQYYETDGMKIVHHSNYLRWMEEARCEFLDQVGFPYDVIEEHGFVIPVLEASLKYKMATTYGETVHIYTKLDSFNGLKYVVSYRILSEDEQTVHCTGTTTHCFLTKDMKPTNIKKTAPAIYEKMMELLKEE